MPENPSLCGTIVPFNWAVITGALGSLGWKSVASVPSQPVEVCVTSLDPGAHHFEMLDGTDNTTMATSLRLTRLQPIG